MALRPHQVPLRPAALRALQLDVYGEPWGIDSPAAEQNLSRRVKTATAIAVEDPILLTLDDPQLFQHPWIYIVEPGALRLNDTEAARLREFLLRGGTVMFDDFHGPYEWENFERQMKRVFPDRRIIEVAADHPVFSCFLQDRRAIRRWRASDRFSPGAPGRRAASRRICARFSTTPAGR